MIINTCRGFIGDINAEKYGHLTVFHDGGDHRSAKILRLFAVLLRPWLASATDQANAALSAETAMKHTRCLHFAYRYAKRFQRFSGEIIQLDNSVSAWRFHCHNSRIQPQGVTSILIGIYRSLFRKICGSRWIHAYFGGGNGFFSRRNVILVTFRACIANFREGDIEYRGIGY